MFKYNFYLITFPNVILLLLLNDIEAVYRKQRVCGTVLTQNGTFIIVSDTVINS